MRSITILGATGSIGESAFDLLMRSGGPDRWRVIALTGGANIARLAQMARALRAEIAVTAYPELLDDLSAALAGSEVRVAAGPAAAAVGFVEVIPLFSQLTHFAAFSYSSTIAPFPPSL